MLDNFGMGEFLMLALFALLFFGPERLPQIGAQLGKWLSKLTSYSRAFMNQWTEEAAAVQGAVQDVMMIRDEIRAAQAEIAESLNAAQKDINETIAVAKGTIQEATPTAEGFAQTQGAPALANAEDANRFQGSRGGSSGGDDSKAVSKTQDIVNSLLIKQGIAPQEDAETEDEAAAPSAAADEDEAYQENLAAIQEIMGKSTKTVPDRADSSTEEAPVGEAEQDETTAQAVVTQPTTILGGSIVGGQLAGSESKPKREGTESAFDKTQAILNRLMGIEPEPEPEPEPESEPEPEPTVLSESIEHAETPAAASEASDVTEEPLAVQTPTVADAPATESPAPTSAKTWAVQHARGPENGVSMSEFTELSVEVNLLKRELRTLREELQALRTQEPERAAFTPLSEGGEAGPKGDSSSVMAGEEVA